MVEEQGNVVQKRIKGTSDSKNWTAEQAKRSIESAQYDLEVAKGALADGNAPGFERAIARAEAYFIEADPEGSAVHSTENLYETPQGKILDQESIDEEISFVDLTSNHEEE